MANKFKPWTSQEISGLKQAPKHADGTAAGLREYAEKIGRNEGSVTQKYYNLMSKNKKAKTANKVKKPAAAKTAMKVGTDFIEIPIVGVEIDLNNQVMKIHYSRK